DNLADAESLTAVEKEDDPDTELDILTDKSDNELGERENDNEDEEDLDEADDVEEPENDDVHGYDNEETRRAYGSRFKKMEESIVEKNSKKFGTFGIFFIWLTAQDRNNVCPVSDLVLATFMNSATISILIVRCV
uniref:Uncharacterized protein n=1 Tax=Anopheles maculatus TaxID=74869 RepID=A0A182SUA9_9DIPT